MRFCIGRRDGASCRGGQMKGVSLGCVALFVMRDCLSVRDDNGDALSRGTAASTNHPAIPIRSVWRAKWQMLTPWTRAFIQLASGVSSSPQPLVTAVLPVQRSEGCRLGRRKGLYIALTHTRAVQRRGNTRLYALVFPDYCPSWLAEWLVHDVLAIFLDHRLVTARASVHQDSTPLSSTIPIPR